MYHLKLMKALSYSGVVTATQKRPDVFTEDKAIADKAVATGYFKLENTESSLPNNGSNTDDFIPDGIMPDGEDEADNPNNTMPGNGDSADDSIPDGIMSNGEDGCNAGDFALVDEKPQGKILDDMTRAELETFATYKNVSVKGLPKKSDIIAKLREVLGPEETSGSIPYGSPTMTELQQE